MLLEQINHPNDIKSIPKEDLGLLADEIREFLIDKVSVTGGHLASNLGVVELTMALHLCLDLPKDKILWDVGHQSYTHKILTGRREAFDTLRQFQGMSGFPKQCESDCDAFNTGHSSTSISAGLGMVCSRILKGEDNCVVSVIGDGSLTGGMAYEAMNNAADIKSNYIIILNDNNMSISENVGGVSRYLSGIRTTRGYNQLKTDVTTTLSKIPNVGNEIVRQISRTKSVLKQIVIPGMLFEDMGLTYIGPVDGHDIPALCRVINDAKKVDRAVVVHVRTKKGKGYVPAEEHPSRFHGIAPFERESGMLREEKKAAAYTDIFARMLCNIAEKYPDIVGITAAMPDGTGMKPFAKRYPERFFDVGIAEEHAVTFAAGMASQGFHPVFAVYSSFLQRGFDQVLHDVCIQNLPVIFAIDRSGLVGSDGETHHGIFDLSYLSLIPNLIVFAPKNKYEFMDAMDFAASIRMPFAIRYPKGDAYKGLRQFHQKIELGKSEQIYLGSQVMLLAVGSMVKTGEEVASLLKEKGIDAGLINMRFVKPLDTDCLDELAEKVPFVVTMEENVLSGGMGEQISAYLSEHHPGIRVTLIGIEDCFVTHGSVKCLKQMLHLDAESIAERVEIEYREANAGGVDTGRSGKEANE